MEWFLKCVKEHYFDFNGRARRKEYWMFTLVNIIISVALSVVLGLISEKLLPIANLYSLAVLLPALGVTARRLHDINKSGWLWGGGSFGAGERVASDGWKPDVARV